MESATLSFLPYIPIGGLYRFGGANVCNGHLIDPQTLTLTLTITMPIVRSTMMMKTPATMITIALTITKR